MGQQARAYSALWRNEAHGHVLPFTEGICCGSSLFRKNSAICIEKLQHKSAGPLYGTYLCACVISNAGRHTDEAGDKACRTIG